MSELAKEAKEAKEETAPEAKEAKAEAAPEAAPAVVEEKAATLEAFFSDNHKDGDYFFKRKSGKPRFRMISVRKSQAKLFYYSKNEWLQKTAMPKTGNRLHGVDWHVRNKWLRIEKKDVKVEAAPRKAKPAAEAEAKAE